MALLQIGEVFGHDTAIQASRPTTNFRHCPFKNGDCTKGNKLNPLGICSFTDGHFATAVCPVRFLESDILFHDAAKIAFGEGATFAAVPEVRVLEVESNSRIRKIGKGDFLITHIH